MTSSITALRLASNTSRGCCSLRAKGSGDSEFSAARRLLLPHPGMIIIAVFAQTAEASNWGILQLFVFLACTIQKHTGTETTLFEQTVSGSIYGRNCDETMADSCAQTFRLIVETRLSVIIMTTRLKRCGGDPLCVRCAVGGVCWSRVGWCVGVGRCVGRSMCRPVCRVCRVCRDRRKRSANHGHRTASRLQRNKQRQLLSYQCCKSSKLATLWWCWMKRVRQ